MRIALADVKKRISRNDGELVVTPHLLGPRQLTPELDALIALYEAYLGRERAEFPADRPAEIIGDYRLARCLTLVLDEWYGWQPAAWPGSADAREVAALAERGIASPSDLRLALYDRVNAAAGGYLPAAGRERELDAFAADLGVERRTLDDLLRLDADERARLTRSSAEPPTVRELATRYNQQVFEALLANASQVEWLISSGPAAAAGTSVGAVVKRICFLARRLGVQYEVGFAAPEADNSSSEAPDVAPPESLRLVAERRAAYATAAAASLDAAPRSGPRSAVYVTLFGPLEVTGAPQQYGERLARLCRALLGYRRAPEDPGRAVFSGLASVGAARVYVRGRPMLLRLDERLLKLVSSAPARLGAGGLAQPDALPVYDSAVEGRLAAEFAALEASGESRGWRLEREPEPVVVGDTILVPDFTVARGARRVFLEIAGYWRPEYRERKARKLLAVRGAVDLVVVAPVTASEAFAGLESALPVLWYHDAPRASALLDLLDAAFDDFAERLAHLDYEQVRREVAARGRVPPQESMALLHCYSRAELARALETRLAPSERYEGDTPPVWMDDLGLCDPGWLQRALGALQWLVAQAPDGRLPLVQLAEALSEQVGLRPALTESGAEALTRRAGLRVARSSLFAAEVLAADASGDSTSAPDAIPLRVRPSQPQPRRARRRSQHQSAAAPQSLFPQD